jgi:hypothetical protein
MLFSLELAIHIALNNTVRLFDRALPHQDGSWGKNLHVVLLLNNANCIAPRSMLALCDYQGLRTGDV